MLAHRSISYEKVFQADIVFYITDDLDAFIIKNRFGQSNIIATTNFKKKITIERFRYESGKYDV